MNLIKLTVEESTWFVGITPLAMTYGVLISIPISEKLGRKKIFLISNVFSILGYISVYFAPAVTVLILAEVSSVLGWGWGP